MEQQVWQRFPEKLGGLFEIVKSFLVEAWGLGPKPCESLRRCDGACSVVFSVAVAVVERTDTRVDSDVKSALSLTSWLNLGKLPFWTWFPHLWLTCLGKPMEGSPWVLASVDCVLSLCWFCSLLGSLRTLFSASWDSRWTPGLQSIGQGLVSEAPSMQPNLESLCASSSTELWHGIFPENLVRNSERMLRN